MEGNTTNMEGFNGPQVLRLGISDLGETRQTSTILSDTPAPSNKSPEESRTTTPRVGAATPYLQESSSEKAATEIASMKDASPIFQDSSDNAATEPSSLKATTLTAQDPSLDKAVIETASIKATTPTAQVDSLKLTANGNPESAGVDTNVSTRTLRKRKEPTEPIDLVSEAIKPLTDEERQSWKGWVELESDPAVFNYIMRKYGVQDVKIQEVFGLDEECMAYVPKPIYGMIFLFKYHDDDAEGTDDSQKCPKHVWFANQTINNACATVALLNVVMNVPGLDIGENLQAFKQATQRLKPPYRGKRLGDNEFIRGIHNSFARKIDVLNADLCLKNEYEKWVKTSRSKKKTPAKRNWGSNNKRKNKDNEEGYHFIAYVPIRGEVWRFDGLQREPVNLGPSGEDWIDVASANIMDRAIQYQDDGVEYSLMSLCKSPTRVAIEEIASNMHLVQLFERTLTSTTPDWKVFLPNTPAATLSSLLSTWDIKISQELIDASLPSPSAFAKLSAVENEPDKLMALYGDLVQEQTRLCGVYGREVGMVGLEDEMAEKKKVDRTPVLFRAMQALAEAGVLRDIVEDLREQKKK